MYVRVILPCAQDTRKCDGGRGGGGFTHDVYGVHKHGYYLAVARSNVIERTFMLSALCNGSHNARISPRRVDDATRKHATRSRDLLFEHFLTCQCVLFWESLLNLH